MTLAGWFVSAQAAVTILVVAVLLLERLGRRVDAATWHGVWTGVAMAVLSYPGASLVIPARFEVAPLDLAGPGSALNGSPTLVFLTLYGVGTCLLLARLFAGWTLVRRLARQGIAPEGMWLGRLQALVGEASSVCRVHVRVQVPVTVGWRRPVVLLPEHWVAWEDGRLRAVIRHELAHIERGDYVWNLVAAFVQAVYWINPCAWLLARRIRLRAELACDRAAAHDLGAAEYAGVLVQTARELLRLGRHTAMLAPGAATGLEARIQALVGEGVSSLPTSRRAKAALAVVVAILAVATMCVRFANASAEPITGPGDTDHAALHQQRHAH